MPSVSPSPIRVMLLFTLFLLTGPAAAQAWDGAPAGAQREILSKRTATSATWERNDGKRVSWVSAAPVHWRDESGDWRKFDLTLSQTRDRFVARAGRASVELPQAVGSGRDGAIELKDGDEWVRLWIENADAAGETNGQRAFYPGVMPHVDLKLRPMTDGVKEEIVLRTADAPRTYAYRLELSAGLTHSLTMPRAASRSSAAQRRCSSFRARRCSTREALRRWLSRLSLRVRATPGACAWRLTRSGSPALGASGQ